MHFHYIYISSINHHILISETKPANFDSGIFAVGIYLVHDGKILLLKYKTKYGGQWTIPSGKTDFQEDKLDAVLREVREEAGILLHSEQVHYLYYAYVQYPKIDFLWFVYLATLTKKPPVHLSDEHSEYIWVTPQEALTMDLIEHEDWCIKKAFGLK